MFTIIKVFIILFLLSLCEKRAYRKFSKQINNLSFQLSVQLCSLLGQKRRGDQGLFWRVEEGGPQEHLVVIRMKGLSFVKFEIILPLLCITRPLYK